MAEILPDKAKFAVIGGGIIGLAIAYFLAERGEEVVILDKGDLGSGASGVNLGQISLIDREPQLHLEWALESMKIYKHLSLQEGIDFELELDGGLMVLTSEKQEAAAKKLVRKQQESGLEVRYLAPDRIEEVEPLLTTDNLRGAVYCPQEGSLEPLKTVFGLAKAITDRGGKICKYTEVMDFDISRGNIKKIKTNKGSLTAEKVILATGSWTRELGKKIGLDIPVYYHRGSAMVTSPLPTCIRNVIVSGGFLTPGARDRELIIGLALAQHQNGSIIIGQATEKSENYNRELTIRGVRGMAGNFLQYFPALSELEIIRCWAGNTPYTGDGLPCYGYSAKINNLFIAAGLKGAFSTAPAAGKMAAEIMCEGRVDKRIKLFSPARSV